MVQQPVMQQMQQPAMQQMQQPVMQQMQQPVMQQMQQPVMQQQQGNFLGGGMDDFLGGGGSGGADLLGMNAPAVPMAPIPIQQPAPSQTAPQPKSDKFGGLVSLDG